MNADQVKTLTEEIIATLEAGATIASIAVPQIAPFVVIGRAVDKFVPGLASNIAKWANGDKPTPEEVADLRNKLAVLGDPNNP